MFHIKISQDVGSSAMLISSSISLFFFFSASVLFLFGYVSPVSAFGLSLLVRQLILLCCSFEMNRLPFSCWFFSQPILLSCLVHPSFPIHLILPIHFSAAFYPFFPRILSNFLSVALFVPLDKPVCKWVYQE